MKKAAFSIYFILMITALYAQKVQNPAYHLMLRTLLKHDVNEMDVTEAVKNNNMVWVDARKLAEYKVSHIKNAVWTGEGDTFDLTKLEGIPKDTTIIVYCSVGYRSEGVTRKLKRAGYKNVSNLYGGIFEWVNEGHPVYSNGKRTDKVHAYSKTWGIWLKRGEKVYD